VILKIASLLGDKKGSKSPTYSITLSNIIIFYSKSLCMAKINHKI
jgi:hypothetical protein